MYDSKQFLQIQPNAFYSFYMAAVINIISRCGVRKEADCTNQPNMTKLVLCKSLSGCTPIARWSTSCYKGGCGMDALRSLKDESLGYKINSSVYCNVTLNSYIR